MFQLVSQSLAVLARHPAVAALLFLPFAIYGAVGDEIFDWYYNGMTAENVGFLIFRVPLNRIKGVLASSGLLLIGQFYLYLIAAIGWHRYLILGERPWSRGLLPGRIERRFFYRVVVLALVVVFAFAGLALILLAIGYALNVYVLPWLSEMSAPWLRALLWVRGVLFQLGFVVIAVLVVSIIMLRLWVALVDRALERDNLNMRDAWGATASWRGRVLVFVVVTLIARVLASLLAEALENLLPGSVAMVVSVTTSAAISFCVAALDLTAITLLYREVTRRTEDVFA
ncbi:hypothetical protein GGD81_000474 [Rhodobium orientis]|uniref:hypothetical protein n=1 Tax=Rhodobium orientis TaxID=34017 RepID=UPI0011B94692|nr:hypothetical protein [Rhodobium orientis]MBB4301459.1 hypothetical protein [Rhodobium orientis]